MMNLSRPTSDQFPQPMPKKLSTLKKATSPSMETSTGPKKVESVPSKTKDNVAPAGLSVPPDPSNLCTKSKAKVSVSQNNNWLTAQALTETTDAMEDGHPALSNTSSPKESPEPAHTPMSPKTRPANPKEEATKSAARPQPVDAQDSKTISTPDQSQSPSMPPTGANIHQEFSAIAQPALTMPSYSSESLIITGKSRTHGEPDGEKEDTSDSPEESQPVESAAMPEPNPTDPKSKPVISKQINLSKNHHYSYNTYKFSLLNNEKKL